MGLFGNSKAKETARFMAPQWLKIARDCTNLVNKTTNPEVFFSRYDLLIEQYRNLAGIEHLVKFSGTKPSAQLRNVIASREHETELFLKRAFDKLTQDINKLKTAKAKGNRVDAFFSKMECYKDYLTPSNIALLEKMELACHDLETKW